MISNRSRLTAGLVAAMVVAGTAAALGQAGNAAHGMNAATAYREANPYPSPALVEATVAALPPGVGGEEPAATVEMIFDSLFVWQSMDNAPKDKRILLGRYRDGDFLIGLGEWVVLDDDPNRPGAWSTEEWFNGVPTHWAAVPAAPPAE